MNPLVGWIRLIWVPVLALDTGLRHECMYNKERITSLHACTEGYNYAYLQFTGKGKLSVI